MTKQPRAVSPSILTINMGSSSLKAVLFAIGSGDPSPRWSLQIERIGTANGKMSIAGFDYLPNSEYSESGHFPTFASALNRLIAELERDDLLSGLTAIGHRVVHGGAHYSAPEIVSPAMLVTLRDLFTIDPEHLPQAVAAIETLADRFPGLPQIACFDTHFHDTMPPEAKLLPIPRWLRDEGVRRYGFHGLSYESIMATLHRIDPVAARGRIVIAHLGSGASMVAVREGRSVDTTMSFTPSGGLMMGTRPGDLDPGLLLYLLQVRAMSPEAINHLLNNESGLLGVSGTSQDLRDLLAMEASDIRAREAVTLFCQIAKKQLAGLAAIMGGIDSLIFTGGIGEHAAVVRNRICAGLEFLGISLDPAKNHAHEAVISSIESATTVRVMHTDEALTVARRTVRLITTEGNTNAAF